MFTDIFRNKMDNKNHKLQDIFLYVTNFDPIWMMCYLLLALLDIVQEMHKNKYRVTDSMPRSELFQKENQSLSLHFVIYKI